jgi:hypothetical protein
MFKQRAIIEGCKSNVLLGSFRLARNLSSGGSPDKRE